jgi:hypothetical protein
VGAFAVVREVHVHIETCNGVLRFAAAGQYFYRMRKTLDAHLVDGNLASITVTMRISDQVGCPKYNVVHREIHSLTLFSPRKEE